MDNNGIKQRLDAYIAENFLEEKKIPANDAYKCYESFAFGGSHFCRKINFDKIFEKNKDETFSEKMTRLVEESGEKNSVIYKRAQIDRQLFSRIKKNKDYQPSKDTAVALALALKLNLSKAKDFLASAGYALTNSSKRDVIISFFLENEIFDTDLLNDYLYEYKQPVLFGR
ncbi:MAG: hypothetical protein IJQ85_07545 [Selenomonadaceae bacterium]|nr:hypothetical protein [Selenomonadaceae bacterium]